MDVNRVFGTPEQRAQRVANALNTHKHAKTATWVMVVGEDYAEAKEILMDAITRIDLKRCEVRLYRDPVYKNFQKPMRFRAEVINEFSTG